MASKEERRRKFYAAGRAAGRQFRPGGPGREAARRVGGTLLRRVLFRFLRRW